MSYIAFQKTHTFDPQKGLEGPFSYPSGKVLYYDPAEGKYYDPTTDFYLEHDEASIYLNEIFEILKKG
jgi:hypothetical protein